jgi:AraC-like DNA-binding protein
MIVQDELKKLGLTLTHIQLGEVDIVENITEEQREKVRAALTPFGLELMDDQKSVLIEKIKKMVVEMIHYSDELPKIKFSNYLAEKLKYNYTYLSNLFSTTEGITIEQYILVHKIERVKELLIYEEVNITQIAHQLHYSSVAHLSSQFKKITGLTPSYFKSMKTKKRACLEDL